MNHTAINRFLIAGVILTTLHTHATTLLKEDFNQYLTDSQHQILPPQGPIADALANQGTWFQNQDIVIASTTSSKLSMIPPAEPSKGAALRLGDPYFDDKFVSISLDEVWEEGTKYSIKIRSRVANKWGGYTDGTEHGWLKASIATWPSSPSKRKLLWIKGVVEDQVPSTQWITTTLNFNTDEKPEAIGKPIILRLSHNGDNTKGYFVWIDHVQIENDKVPSVQNRIIIPYSEGHAQYLAQQAAKEFNLTPEQKNALVEQYKLAIQCKNEIETLIKNGRAVEAKAYSDLIKESIQDFMLGQIGIDQKPQLQLFNNKMALEINQ